METNEIKEFVDELREQWKDLWLNRIDDKVRAVIMATRDYKPLEFFDIVQQYLSFDAEKAVPPNSTIGGWGKFIRNKIRNQKNTIRRFAPPKPTHTKGQQLKKGGRGWLHIKMR